MRNSFPLNTAVLPAIIKIHSNKSTFYKFSDVRISLKKKKKTFDISAHGAQNLYETNLTGPSGNLNRSEKKIGITAAQCFFALPQCSLMGLIISYYSNTGWPMTCFSRENLKSIMFSFEDWQKDTQPVRSCFNVELLDVDSLFTGGPQLLALWFSSQNCYFLQEIYTLNFWFDLDNMVWNKSFFLSEAQSLDMELYNAESFRNRDLLDAVIQKKEETKTKEHEEKPKEHVLHMRRTPEITSRPSSRMSSKQTSLQTEQVSKEQSNVTTESVAKNNVSQTINSLAVLCLAASVVLVLDIYVFLMATSDVPEGGFRNGSLLSSVKQYEDVTEVFTAFSTLVMILSSNCVLVCSMQCFIASKVIKTIDGPERWVQGTDQGRSKVAVGEVDPNPSWENFPWLFWSFPLFLKLNNFRHAWNLSLVSISFFFYKKDATCIHLIACSMSSFFFWAYIEVSGINEVLLLQGYEVLPGMFQQSLGGRGGLLHIIPSVPFK